MRMRTKHVTQKEFVESVQTEDEIMSVLGSCSDADDFAAELDSWVEENAGNIPEILQEALYIGLSKVDIRGAANEIYLAERQARLDAEADERYLCSL